MPRRLGHRKAGVTLDFLRAPWRQVGFLREGLGVVGGWAGFGGQRQEASPSPSKHQRPLTQSCPHLTFHSGEKVLSTWERRDETGPGQSPGVEDGGPGPRPQPRADLDPSSCFLFSSAQWWQAAPLWTPVSPSIKCGAGALAGPESLLSHADQPARETLLESMSTILSPGKP